MIYVEHYRKARTFQQPITNSWLRRGKRYRSKAMAALKELYGESHYDKECQSEEGEPQPDRGRGANSICDLADETRVLAGR